MMKKQEQKIELLKNSLGYILEEELVNEIINNSQLKEIEQDKVIVNVGDELNNIPIVLEGSIKISRENEEGEELLLYYIEGGDTCAMTLQCCVRHTKSEIRATTMEKSLILMIPINMMEVWLHKYKSWREYILQSYHTRMTELMETIDAITFMRLDERLLKYLTDQAKLLGSLEINHTHQQIAEDLHSSRVVISELLNSTKSISLQACTVSNKIRFFLS